MKNKEHSIKLEWINQDEFTTFLENAKEKCKSGESFTNTFCLKFAHGNELKWKFPFNQEGGFYFSK